MVFELCRGPSFMNLVWAANQKLQLTGILQLE